MSWLKDVFEKLDVKNRGYKVNRWLTNGAFILLILYMAFIVHVDGLGVLAGEMVYVECPSDSVDSCVNPYYEFFCFDELCEDEFLFPSQSIGIKPSLFARTFGFVALLVIGLALLLNHLLYNMGYKFRK